MEKRTAEKRTLDILARRGLVHARDVKAHRLHTQVLTRLVREGKIERSSRGLYRLPLSTYNMTEHHGLVLATAAAPKRATGSDLHFVGRVE